MPDFPVDQLLHSPEKLRIKQKAEKDQCDIGSRRCFPSIVPACASRRPKTEKEKAIDEDFCRLLESVLQDASPQSASQDVIVENFDWTDEADERESVALPAALVHDGMEDRQTNCLADSWSPKPEYEPDRNIIVETKTCVEELRELGRANLQEETANIRDVPQEINQLNHISGDDEQSLVSFEVGKSTGSFQGQTSTVLITNDADENNLSDVPAGFDTKDESGELEGTIDTVVTPDTVAGSDGTSTDGGSQDSGYVVVDAEVVNDLNEIDAGRQKDIPRVADQQRYRSDVV